MQVIGGVAANPKKKTRLAKEEKKEGEEKRRSN